MAYSYKQYPGDGSTTNFVFDFGYLSRAHIHVFVDGVEVPFSFLSDFSVQVTPAPAAGTIVEVRRMTPLDNPAVDWNDGSTLTEADMDLDTIFNLYANQEARDYAEASVQLDSEGIWDGRGRATRNFADPIGPDSLVTKKYFDDVYTPELDEKVAAAAASAAASQASATASAASALNSANSAEDSAESLDEFLKRYMGARPTNPTTRYDGSPLQVGDLYFNSTVNEMRVWAAGGYWEEATPTIQAIMEGTFTAPIIATEGQTVVPVVGGYDAPFVIVWVNGSQIEQPEIDVTDGQNIVFSTPLTAGDEVTYRAFGAFKTTELDSLRKRVAYTASDAGILADGSDESAKLQAAIIEAVSRGVPLELEGKRIRINQQVLVQIAETGKTVQIQNGTIEGDVANTFLQIEGTSLEFAALSQAAVLPYGATTVTAGAPVGVTTPGLIFRMRSSVSWYHDPRPSDPGGGCRKGELTRIVDVSGTTVRIQDPLHDTYATSELIGYSIYSSPRVILKDLEFRAVGAAASAQSGPRGAWVANAVDVVMENLTAHGCSAGTLYLLRCHSGSVDNCFAHGANSPSGGYGLMLSECKDITFNGCHTYGCRRGFDVTGAIPSRDIIYDSCEVTGGGLQADGLPYFNPTAYMADPNNAGVSNAGFSTHGGAENVKYIGCITSDVEFPYIQRGRNVTVTGNTHYGPCQRFVSCAYGFGTFVTNNRVLAGHSYNGDSRSVPGSWAPQQFVMTRRGTSTHGYDITGPIVIRDNFVEGVQQAFFYMEGAWGTGAVDISITGNRGHVRRETLLEEEFDGIATGSTTQVSGITGQIEYYDNQFQLDSNITGKYVEVMERIRLLFGGVLKTGPKRYSGSLPDDGVISFPVDAYTKGGVFVRLTLTSNNISNRARFSHYMGFVYDYDRFAGDPLVANYIGTVVRTTCQSTVLTGTTGPDNSTNMSCVGQRFYIENRNNSGMRYTVEFDEGV